MKSLPSSLLALAASFTLIGCSSTGGGQLPPVSSIGDTGTAGSLATQALTQDTTAAIRNLTGGNKPITKYTLNKPVGKPGNKAWREVWIYDAKGKAQQFLITFQEKGGAAADFEIREMKD